MELGSILHHKYFNGVTSPEESSKYQDSIINKFRYFGMFGTGMMKAITSFSNDTVVYNFINIDKLCSSTNEVHHLS